MKERVIYDPGEPVAIRRYAAEALAALDQALLRAADISAFIRRADLEVDPLTVLLVVRREDAAAALKLLDSPPPADDASIEPPDDGS